MSYPSPIICRALSEFPHFSNNGCFLQRQKNKNTLFQISAITVISWFKVLSVPFRNGKSLSRIND